MLGYGINGGGFGGGSFQSPASNNPFVGNMTGGVMLPGGAASSADSGQNATGTQQGGSSPFDNSDGYWNGEAFGPGGDSKEPFTSSWRKSLGMLWKNRRGKAPTTPPKNNMPAPMTGPLASSLQATPMTSASYNNPFTYF